MINESSFPRKLGSGVITVAFVAVGMFVGVTAAKVLPPSMLLSGACSNVSANELIMFPSYDGGNVYVDKNTIVGIFTGGGDASKLAVIVTTEGDRIVTTLSVDEAHRIVEQARSQ